MGYLIRLGYVTKQTSHESCECHHALINIKWDCVQYPQKKMRFRLNTRIGGHGNRAPSLLCPFLIFPLPMPGLFGYIVPESFPFITLSTCLLSLSPLTTSSTLSTYSRLASWFMVVSHIKTWVLKRTAALVVLGSQLGWKQKKEKVETTDCNKTQEWKIISLMKNGCW